jgi:23S rRNA pseudouridine1911/1915/1917 synthase
MEFGSRLRRLTACAILVRMANEWTVTQADAKKRLDVFLSGKIEGLSRSQAKKRIESGGFLVNGKTASGHRFLKTGDVITQSDLEKAPEPGSPALARVPAISIAPEDLRIIQETPGWIVVYKPAGVLMHPDHDHPEGTLIDAVAGHAPEVARVGEDPSRPGIVSRLDKDVSGLAVIAKTQDAFDDLKKQFAEHSVKKEYVALVYGEMEDDEGDVKFRIGRSSSKARMAALPENAKQGQAAWTHYDVMERFKGATLLKLQILTGRTHQIRAHLHALNHPVIGDPLYKPKSATRKISAPRLLLQSVALEFDDPKSGQRQSFEIELDKEFDQMIKFVRAGLPRPYKPANL